VRWTSKCDIGTGPSAGSGAGIPDPCNLEQGSTSEGPVVMEWHDTDLLILEGYDKDVLERARGVFFYHMTPPPAPNGKK